MTKLIKHDLFDDETMDFLKEDRHVTDEMLAEVPDKVWTKEMIAKARENEELVTEEEFNNLPLTKEHRNLLLVKLNTLTGEAINILYVVEQILRFKNLLNGIKNAEVPTVTKVVVCKECSVEFYTSVKEDD